jgi:ribosomal protein S18 acetylase RimI-like enzyme
LANGYVSWFRSSLRRRSESPPAASQPEELAESGPPAESPASSEARTAVAVASPEELTGRPLADLHALAREHGVPRYRLLRKQELVEALGGAPAPGATVVAVPEPEPRPEPPALRIEEVKAASVDVLDALQRLVGELSSSAAKPHAAELEEIIESPVTRLIVARNESDDVVGMLTLVLFRIPTGMRAWIEDVVVDRQERGEGIGKRLVREAIRIANENRARTIDLTSNRSREVANRMYRNLGFNPRETTVYRIDAANR